MKTTQKITAFFLAALFLTSSLGFTVSRMVCLKSGMVKISIQHASDCCAEKNNPAPVIREKCCDVISTGLHLGDFQVAQKFSVEKPPALLSFFHRTGISSFSISFSKPSTAAAEGPPPLRGPELLHFISVLTI